MADRFSASKDVCLQYLEDDSWQRSGEDELGQQIFLGDRGDRGRCRQVVEESLGLGFVQMMSGVRRGGRYSTCKLLI